ncbi:hypothetical protein [Arthrobacter sp. Z1-15]
MNQHYEDARSILSIRVPGDTLEGVVVMLEAQAEATLAVAYAQETANLIAHASNVNPNADVVAQITERLGLA